MSFEDTNCPCGGKKPRDTMLCDDCEASFKDHPSMIVFKDGQNTLDARQHSAMVLLALSHKRKRTQHLHLDHPL